MELARRILTHTCLGTGMSRAYSTETHPKGWIIPQAVQMIPAVIVLALIWFTPGKILITLVIIFSRY